MKDDRYTYLVCQAIAKMTGVACPSSSHDFDGFISRLSKRIFLAFPSVKIDPSKWKEVKPGNDSTRARDQARNLKSAAYRLVPHPDAYKGPVVALRTQAKPEVCMMLIRCYAILNYDHFACGNDEYAIAELKRLYRAAGIQTSEIN